MKKKQTKIIKLTIIIFCFFLLGYLLLLSNNSQPHVELETSWFNKKKELTDKDLIKQLADALRGKPLPADYRMSNRLLSINSLKESKKLSYFGSSLLSVTEKKLYILSKELSNKLDSIFTDLEREFYGEALAWSEAKLFFSKNKDAIVTDLETGLSFKVRRKASTYHADVQPVTAGDTEIMKKIYKGNWSWKRRAIILTVDGKRIAASMNGMPHGAGSIKGNNFPGHFCIHFLDSKVHKSNKVDLAHQLMIAKASGKIFTEIYTATPEKLVTIFFTALKQHDWNLVELILGSDNSDKLDEALKNLQSWEDVKKFTIHKAIEISNLLCKIPVSIVWRKKGETNYNITEMTLILKKSCSEGEWYISSYPFQEI